MWEHVNRAWNQSMDRVMGGIADFLPGALALLIAIILALPVAWIVSRVLRRSLQSMRFDERLQQLGITTLANWAPSQSPALLVARIAYWIILLFGLLVGLTALNAEWTSRLAVRAIEYMPNLLLAVLILTAGNLIARFVARGVLISAVNMQLESARLISLGVKWMILVCTAAMALEHLGIGVAIVRVAFAILFGGIVLALALAVGLGSRDVIARSWERREEKGEERSSHPFQHL